MTGFVLDRAFVRDESLAPRRIKSTFPVLSPTAKRSFVWSGDQAKHWIMLVCKGL